MASIAGADAYFENTLREDSWASFGHYKNQRAINEAVSMLSRLSFSATPPMRNMDNAIYEQAYCLLTMPEDAQQRLHNIASGLKSFTAGKQSESYQNADQVASLTNGMMLCPGALSWIDAYLRPKSAARSGRLIMGRDCHGARY